ncbi:MAG: glyoxylate/hydroxypyruvate reductase A [Kiloniellaceae bacterium]|nr:glyoxylate/hydroxypyruvate reductase A [Kiloniellaceae bacterium]
MSLVVRVGSAARAPWWRDTLQSLLPEVDVRLWDDPGDRSKVEYAVVWQPPPGGLKSFPNLKVIVSMGAGIDHVLRDPELPRHLPIIRTVGPDLRQRMREYVLLHVLRLHRRLPETEASFRRKEWNQLITPVAPERPVGVLGLGNMGADSASHLAHIGFEVHGWSRRPKNVAGVICHSAAEGLDRLLKRVEILVCLLPLTPQTTGILNKELFAKLPEGACLINAGRGQHLVEEDLIPALDSGQLGGATLDVLQVEPAAEDHPFWTHPKILLTPHIASLIDPEVGSRLIAANLKLFMAGKPVPDMVDVAQGY